MHRVFGNGNLLNLFSQQKLKEDAYGRSNVLILDSTDDMAGRDGDSAVAASPEYFERKSLF